MTFTLRVRQAACAVLVPVVASTLAACAPMAHVVPILLAPRFNGGSIPDQANEQSFLIHRGFDADKLHLGDSYRPLVGALETRGYKNDETLFQAAYDWRMP